MVNRFSPENGNRNQTTNVSPKERKVTFEEAKIEADKRRSSLNLADNLKEDDRGKTIDLQWLK